MTELYNRITEKKAEFTAKLIAFLKVKDLPELLCPFVNMMEIRDKINIQTNDIQC